jgi:hypothetical protein
MKCLRIHRSALFLLSLVLLAVICTPDSEAQRLSFAEQWVESHRYPEVLALARRLNGSSLFSPAEFARAIARPASKHSAPEREVAMAVLLDRTSSEEAAEVLQAVLPVARVSEQWSLLASTLRLIDRTPALQGDPRIDDYITELLDEIANALTEGRLPADATSATLAAIDAAESMTGTSIAESLRTIAQYGHNPQVVSRARSTARAVLGAP